MAEMEALYAALRKADADGDTDAARRLATYIQTTFAPPVTPAAPPPKSTIGGELVRGAKQLGSTFRTAVGQIGTPEEAAAAAQAGVERGQDIAREAGEGPSFGALQKVYAEKGVLPAAGEVVTQLPRFLASQAPQLAAIAGGARLGAMAGTAAMPLLGPVAPLAPVIGGGLGAMAALYPQFFGANVERQAEAQTERGGSIQIDRGKAATAAAGQAALEAAGGAFALGKTAVKGILGIADDALLQTAKSQAALAATAKRSLAGTIGRGAARGTVTEMPVELAQTVLERQQAGLPLTGPEAYKEYGEAAYGAAMIGAPLGGAGSVYGRAKASGAAAKQEEEARAKAQEELAASGPQLPTETPAGEQGALFTPTQLAGLERQEAEPPLDEPPAAPEAKVPRDVQPELGLEGAREYADMQLERARLEQMPQTEEVKARIAELQRALEEMHMANLLDAEYQRQQDEEARRRFPALAEAPLTPRNQRAMFEEDELHIPEEPTLTLMGEPVRPKVEPGEPTAPKGVHQYRLPLRGGVTAQPFTAQDLQDTGVASRTALGWLTENVVGKTKGEVQALVDADPELVKGKGSRAQTLKMLLAPEVAPPQEVINVEPRKRAKAPPAAPAAEAPAEPVAARVGERPALPARRPAGLPTEGPAAPARPGVAPIAEHAAGADERPTGQPATLTEESPDERDARLAEAQAVRQAIAGEARRRAAPPVAPLSTQQKALPAQQKVAPPKEPTVEDLAPFATPWEILKPKDQRRRSVAGKVKGQSAAEVRAELAADTSRLGRAINKLIQSGKLRIEAASPEEGTAGMFDGRTGTLFADHIPAGGALAVVIHEIGAHMGLKRMMGGTNYSRLADRIREMSKGPAGPARAIAQQALESVPKDTHPSQIEDEIIAYFIENVARAEAAGVLPKTGPVRAVWNQLKAAVTSAVNRVLGTDFGMSDLTPQQISSLAQAALIQEAKTATPAPAKQGQPSLRSKVSPAAEALSIAKALGVEPKVEPRKWDIAKQALASAVENPKLTAEAAKAGTTKWQDKMETAVFSSDAGLNNAITRAIRTSVEDSKQVLGTLLNISTAQANHSEAVAGHFLTQGDLVYEADTHKWATRKSEHNFIALSKKLDAIAAKHGITKQEAEAIAHTAFVARRLDGLSKENDRLQAQADALRARGENAKAAKLDERQKFIHMNPDQIAEGQRLLRLMPELGGVVDTWNGIRTNVAKVMVEGGLWSQEQADDLLDNADYVPFYRDEQLENKAGPKDYLHGLQVQAREKRMKGSAAPVHDVFDNMIRFSQYAVARAVRNRVAVALADTAVDAGLAKRVKAKERDMHVARVWVEGEERLYAMDDPLYMDAFNGLQNVAIPALKWAAKVSNVLRQSIVLNPVFSVAQVPQDAFAAMFSSGLQPKYALSIPVRAVKEFITTLRGTSSANAALRAYGVVGIRDVTAAVVRADAEVYAGIKAPPGFWGRVKRSLDHISMASDNAVRQAVYEAAMAQGMSKAEAIEKAFQVINFRNRGTSKLLAAGAQVIPFFNAYLAAQHVAYKTITGASTSPTDRMAAMKTFAATSASVFALSLMYAMLVGDDDEYKKTRAIVRDRMLMIPGTGTGIPLRSDLFIMPKLIAEHMYHMLTDSGTTDGRAFRDSMAHTVANALLSPTLVPQIAKPLFEVGINHDFFQGRPLIGMFEKQKEAERQFNESTSELGKALGGAVGVAPIAIDHVVRGMLGSLGGLTLYMSNAFMHSDPNVERPSLSARDALAALPGVSGFVTKSTESALKNDFYVLRDEVERATSTLEDLKARSPHLIPDFVQNEKNIARLSMKGPVRNISENLGRIRKAITHISNLPSSQMTDVEKRDSIAKLREAEQEYLKAVPLRLLRERAKL